jgi:hypothetical protein
MPFSLNEFKVELLKDGPDHSQWANVSIRIRDKGTDTYHDVTASVVIPEDPEMPIGAVRQLAADRAAITIEATLALLRGHSASELKAQQWAREDAEMAEIEALQADPVLNLDHP